MSDNQLPAAMQPGYTFVERQPSGGPGGSQRNVAIDALDVSRLASLLASRLGLAASEASRQASAKLVDGGGTAAGGVGSSNAGRRKLLQSWRSSKKRLPADESME